MLKRTLEILMVAAVIAAAGWILWSRTHVSYEEFAKAGENAGEQSAADFPEKVEETVNESFSYHAEVVTGEAFDAENFYESTAVTVMPDEEKWKEYFGVNDTAWAVQSEENGDSVTHYYTDDAGNSLLLMDNMAMFCAHKMTPILYVFDTEKYSETNNAEVFAEPMDLSFESREENKTTVNNAMKALGADCDSLQVVSVYYMSAQRMEEQEQIKVENGDIEDDERKASWGADDEAYYYFYEETSQGLPVLSVKTVTDYNREIKAQMVVCSGADGIIYMKMEDYFQVQQGAEKVSLAPFDKVKECINEKYSQTSGDETITVTKCELCLYPLRTGEGAYTCVPVWICTLERISSQEGRKDVYFPVNALTGEEFFEMEN